MEGQKSWRMYVRISLSLCFLLRLNERVQVCYSFWVLSSLSILGKVHWIDVDKLVAFILSAQVSLAPLSVCITVSSNPFLSYSTRTQRTGV
jgi:hypothetical protein